MTLEIKKNTKETTIKVVGQVDAFTAPVLERTINKIACGATSIVLEFSGVDFVSDAGLRVLLDAHAKMQQSGNLKFVGAREGVMETFKIAGFTDVLAIS